MSVEYDKYLSEHIANVNRALRWMLDNLPRNDVQKQAIEDALNNNHDASKYEKFEYEPYDAYFYGGNRSYKVLVEFNYAWLMHIHRNPHHWQYWVLIEDDPENGSVMKPLPMPLVYVYEMIADWWSFSWRDENLFEIFKWYNEHRTKQYIHPTTLSIIREILEEIWKILIMQETIQNKDISVIEKEYMLWFMRQPEEENEDEDEEYIEHSDTEEDEHKYGVPEQKKFPLPDADHVKSAIRFFNYVDRRYEKELAKAILERAEEYGVVFGEDINVGDDNKFKKYLPKKEEET